MSNEREIQRSFVLTTILTNFVLRRTKTDRKKQVNETEIYQSLVLTTIQTNFVLRWTKNRQIKDKKKNRSMRGRSSEALY